MTLKELITIMANFTSKNGFEISRIFDDLLRYIIHGHTIPVGIEIEEGWNYTKEQNKVFYDMYKAVVEIMSDELKHKEWFDVWGNIYEELIAGKYRRSSSGQFFTPTNLCDLMTEITAPKSEEIRGKKIYDPTSGSGRTLLSFNAVHPGNYLIGEDIDMTCARMTVVNFLLHGVVGEVVCHDTLNPDRFYGAWRINEYLNNPLSKLYGVPHIRKISKEETSTEKNMRAGHRQVVIKEKLLATAEKHRAMIKQITENKPLSISDKEQIRALTIKLNKLKQVIKKYE